MMKFWDGTLPKPGQRTVEDMRSVLADFNACAENTLYFMYRSLSMNPGDKEWLSARCLRYDITVIPPCLLGDEYVKTKGHYHPKAPDGFGFPELYQVISGEAHFLLQKRDLSDVVVVRAKTGDVVLVPPGYGHVTINPSNETLVMANIVSDAFKSEYEFYEHNHGAAYYELFGNVFLKNPNYGDVPKIRFVDAFEVPELKILHNQSIYDLIGDDEVLEYLNNPVILEKINFKI
ncbi:glucose-6-phosphate isomerase [Methanoplanus sp. FWC-SCC4]|uniref:glucose-6-phosphate isomerase n=1 Tax=Methanochimaera problematica TaxID=2609417 RepID=A0AA97FAD0_9EURY|nr:glucose-6-phosphate isomerase family protein [Methanoplanus sp. FWC-SCC4]WOF15252.1 glucose-6-phosphate isomerase [Methanoplanus sp. FWC-SCC4]